MHPDQTPESKSCNNCVHGDVCALLELFKNRLMSPENACKLIAEFCKYYECK